MYLYISRLSTVRAALYIMLSKPKASDFILDDIIKYFP